MELNNFLDSKLLRKKLNKNQKNSALKIVPKHLFGGVLYYLRHLDNYCSRYKKDEFFNEDERKIKKLYTLEELLYIFHKLATKYKIDSEKHGFSAYHMLFYYNMKTVYDSWSDNIFGFCALHILKDNHYFCAPYNQCSLFEMIQEKQRYACCWAQYLKVEEQFLPSYLKSCECLKVCGHLNKVSKYLNAEQFYEIFSDDSEIKVSCMTSPFDNYEDFITSGNNFAKMISDYSSFCGNEDCIIDCGFQGKKYKFITVQTSKGLQSFIDEFLINLKIVGLDSETGLPKDQITVIQLSTEHWFCLIDVQEICKEISHEHPLWMKLFEIIFDEEIIRVGFAFINDFKYLSYTFASVELDDLLEKEESKVLCLQELTNSILESQKTELNGFFSENIKKTCRLSQLSKEELGYEMDKTMQSSDWRQRPLTPFHKIYAVLDALIVVQIYQQLQLRLKEKLESDDEVAKIIQKGFINHVRENMDWPFLYFSNSVFE